MHIKETQRYSLLSFSTTRSRESENSPKKPKEQQMDRKTETAADRVYEDFNPHIKWDIEERSATLRVMLTGYTRDQLKVQLTSTPVLRINGERQITENRWLRFNKEFPIPSNYDTENVSAKFEGGVLYVKFPILTSPVMFDETTNPPEEAPMPQQPTAEAPPQQLVDQQKAPQEATPKTKEDKAETKSNEVSEKKPQKEEELRNGKEKSKPETASSKDKLAKTKVRTNGLTDQTTEATATSKVPEIRGAKTVTRSKTRILDFTPSLGPTNRDYNEAVRDLDTGFNKKKTFMNWVVVTLLVVVLGLYVRNAFKSSLRGSRFQEL